MKTKYILLCVLVGLSTAVSAQTLVSVNKTITQDTTIATVQKNSLTSQTVTASGQAVFSSKTGYVRILLSDDSGYDVLVYESTPLFATNGIDNFSNVSLETEDIPSRLALTKIRVEIKNVELRNVSIEASNTRNSKTQQQVRTDRIVLMNNNLRAQNALWVAGETSVSQMSYQEKKEMFGGKVPDLQGFEYYKGGIFELHSDSVASTQHTMRGGSSYVASFDWRDRHGRNWITPVQAQGNCGSCGAFAAVGALEAVVNLYYNQQINMDLSEQELVSCNKLAAGCAFGSPIDAFRYIRDYGIIDEASFPYQAIDTNCSQKPTISNEKITIKDANIHNPFHIDEIKRDIIKSPLTVSCTYPFNHAMTLVGYKTIQAGDSILIKTTMSWVVIGNNDSRIGQTAISVKNPWGSDWGDDGFGYILIDAYEDVANYTTTKLPITSLNYTDANIICEDRDGDGYYYWGIGPKPAHCPACAPDEPDGDDSNPNLGPMDEYGNCAVITPMVVDFINEDVINEEKEVTSCGNINVQNVNVEQGGKLILKAEGDVIIQGDFKIEAGSEFEIW
ncbi:MAG: C1 family peptidase [Bacteroidetes bacterium]|nr:C1 family peptidase [Bacteroidota bacterium]